MKPSGYQWTPDGSDLPNKSQRDCVNLDLSQLIMQIKLLQMHETAAYLRNCICH